MMTMVSETNIRNKGYFIFTKLHIYELNIFSVYLLRVGILRMWFHFPENSKPEYGIFKKYISKTALSKEKKIQNRSGRRY
jgi:hypothetical protein